MWQPQQGKTTQNKRKQKNKKTPRQIDKWDVERNTQGPISTIISIWLNFPKCSRLLGYSWWIWKRTSKSHHYSINLNLSLLLMLTDINTVHSLLSCSNWVLFHLLYLVSARGNLHPRGLWYCDLWEKYIFGYSGGQNIFLIYIWFSFRVLGSQLSNPLELRVGKVSFLC